MHLAQESQIARCNPVMTAMMFAVQAGFCLKMIGTLGHCGTGLADDRLDFLPCKAAMCRQPYLPCVGKMAWKIGDGLKCYCHQDLTASSVEVCQMREKGGEGEAWKGVLERF